MDSRSLWRKVPKQLWRLEQVPMRNVSKQVNTNVGMDVLPIAPSSPPHHVMNLKFPWYVFRYETLVPPSKPQSISFYPPLPLPSFEKSNSSYALRTYTDIWLPFWVCEKLDGNGYTLGPITDSHGTSIDGLLHFFIKILTFTLCSYYGWYQVSKWVRK